MLELFLWILFGSLNGWIGYLSTRNGQNTAKPYLLLGILAAISGGLFIKLTDNTAGLYSININSLIFALMTSATCMIALGYLSNKSSPIR